MPIGRDGVSFRRAKPEDANGIQILEQVCFRKPWSIEMIEKDLTKNERAVYYVADYDSITCGYVSLYLIEGEGHINNVAVLPGYRRRHVAKRLLNMMIRECEALGIHSFTLEVRADNDAAIELYEKLGFREAGRRPGYYEEDRQDAIIMWRIGKPEEIEDASAAQLS